MRLDGYVLNHRLGCANLNGRFNQGSKVFVSKFVLPASNLGAREIQDAVDEAAEPVAFAVYDFVILGLLVRVGDSVHEQSVVVEAYEGKRCL